MVPAATSRSPMNSSSTFALVGPATCPSCHTEDLTMTNGAVEAGAHWNCSRCGQLWDAVRLKTVAAYAVWLAGRTAGASG